MVERHAYHHYRILEHVEQTPRLTNRRIAQKLNVSVKLAHELLSGLVTRGMLHIRKHNARRWDYFLTPQGVGEKARLTREFIGFTMQFYREARRRSADLLAGLSRKGVARVAFLGANEIAEIASLGAQEWGITVVAVFDPEPEGKHFLGKPVRPAGDINATQAERIVITAFDPGEPMARRYLPPEVKDDPRFVWIFDAPPEDGNGQ